MYVCLCHGITDREILKLRDQGYRSVRAIQAQCNAGANCGACLLQVKEMVSGQNSDESAARNKR
jgi:bacterioferritin-associated ferredoxin